MVRAITALLVLAVGGARLSTNWMAAGYMFLGAFTYGVVYTVWLKRRTWTNIVIGGLAGSFAVLAGAAAVDPRLAPGPVARDRGCSYGRRRTSGAWRCTTEDYARAGVPMLPVMYGDRVRPSRSSRTRWRSC